ncbi:flavin reductase family protein [Streptomyces sp. NPDC006458]|uniref:flavin reductase family protein n=1 Tax=Streptomyces sp. NPDC006458 TaxID=3154302 RepID=UPI0033B3D925
MSAPRTAGPARAAAGPPDGLVEASTDAVRRGGTAADSPRRGETGAPLPRNGEAGTDAFRLAARRWTTGVALLTARHGDEVFAKTVSSLCTLSLDPLLVSVAVSARSPLTAAIRADGRYAVSVLARHQEPVARHFAAPGAGRALGLFTAAPMLHRATGAPVLEDCLAWFDCRLHTVLPGGDHAVLVGRVAAADAVPGEPLIYHHGEYRSLAGLPTPSTGART